MSLPGKFRFWTAAFSTASVLGLAAALVLWRMHSGSTGSELDRAGATPRAQVTGEPVLSDAARQHIWDIEQQAFQISHKAAPQLTAALARLDFSALAEFLADDFRGQVFADSGDRVERPYAKFLFQNGAQHTRVPVGGDEFARWLIERAEQFEHGSLRAQLPLLYLYPVDAEDKEGAWRGTWILRLFGTARDGGPLEIVARGDFASHRLPDDFDTGRKWINQWDIEQLSAGRATHVLMEEMSARSGMDLSRLRDNWQVDRGEFAVTPGGIYACDYNSDGIIDLLVTDMGSATLYAGEGSGRFRDVTLVVGMPLGSTMGPSGATGFADLDNDWDEDMILGAALFENRNGHFVRRGYLRASHAVGISFGDYDRDGRVDLYISNAAPAPNQAKARTSWIDDQSGRPNQLLRNLGDFQFQDVTNSTGAGAGSRSTFTSVWLDADNDQWPDVYVINELGNNVLLHNNREGSFTEQHIGPEFDGFAMGVTAGDIDGDGLPDIYLGNMFSKAGKRIIRNIPPGSYSDELIQRMQSFVAGNMLLVNRGDLRFEIADDSSISGVGWAYGTAFVDLDNDGWLDIHATAGFASFSRTEPDG